MFLSSQVMAGQLCIVIGKLKNDEVYKKGLDFMCGRLDYGQIAWKGVVRHGLEHYKRDLRRQSRRRDFIRLHEIIGADWFNRKRHRIS